MKKGDVIDVPQLTEEQKQAKAKLFEEQKVIIDDNTGAFWQIGKALAKIREGKLFLGVGAGDEIEVGKKYWGFTSAYVTQHIKAAEVMNKLDDVFHNCESKEGEAPPMPTNEYQCRQLRKTYTNSSDWAFQWKRLCKELGRVPTGNEIVQSGFVESSIEAEKAESLEEAIERDFQDFADSMQKLDVLEIDTTKLDEATRAEMLANVKKTIAKLQAIVAQLEKVNEDEN